MPGFTLQKSLECPRKKTTLFGSNDRTKLFFLKSICMCNFVQLHVKRYFYLKQINMVIYIEKVGLLHATDCEGGGGGKQSEI